MGWYDDLSMDTLRGAWCVRRDETDAPVQIGHLCCAEALADPDRRCPVGHTQVDSRSIVHALGLDGLISDLIDVDPNEQAALFAATGGYRS